MKYTFLILLLFVICQMSCKKDTPAIQAKADFSIGVQVLGTHDEISLLSESINADSIRWDLGNGKTFNKKDTIVSFDSAGIYAITLTAFNKNGAKSSISRKITVKERVIKSISINHLQLNAFAPSQNGLPIFAKADLWIEIKYSQSWDPATPNGDILAPVIYQSPLFANVDSAMHSSIIYNLPSANKVIINYPVFPTLCIDYQLVMSCSDYFRTAFSFITIKMGSRIANILQGIPFSCFGITCNGIG